MSGLTSLSELERDDLVALFDRTDAILAGEAPGEVRGRLVVPLLFRPSPETEFRIRAGAATIGASVLDPRAVWRDFPAETDLHESVEMARRFGDLLIVRHTVEGISRRLAEEGATVLGAGDGTRGDALSGLVALDTVRAAIGGPEDRTIAVCGDLARNPVAHSLVRGLAVAGARILLVPARAGELPEGLMAEVALHLGASPVRFPAQTLATFLDMVDTVFLAPRGGSQLGLFDALPPSSDEERRQTRRDARTVDAMVLAAPCDPDGRPEAKRPDVVVYREPFADGAGPGETPPFVPEPGRERALVAALLQRLLTGGFPTARRPRGRSYRAREGLRCGNPACATVRWPERYEPGFVIAREDPVVLGCLDCGAPARARFVGSRRMGRYHPLTSRQVAKIKPENVVFFADEEQAEAAGFVPSLI